MTSRWAAIFFFLFLVHAHQWQEIDLPRADLLHVVGGHFWHYICQAQICDRRDVSYFLNNLQHSNQGQAGDGHCNRFAMRRNTFCKRTSAFYKVLNRLTNLAVFHQ
jgi:hypothetical protein